MGSSKRPYSPVRHRREHDVLAAVRARLGEEHRLQLDVCAAMACLLEDTPKPEEQELIRLVERLLEPSWSEHVALHQGLIFPLLRRHYGTSARIAATLRAFAIEHARIAGLTRAAAENLRQLDIAAQRMTLRRADAACALVEARRRHLADERRFVEALLPTTISVSERIRVEAFLVNHAWPLLDNERCPR